MRAFGCIAIVSSLLLFSCSRSVAPQGHYQESQVNVDGRDTEWSRPLRFASKDYLVSYNVTNDQDNIYVIVETKDDATKKKMLTSGVSIYVDPKGENSHDISLFYPEKKPKGNGGYSRDSTDSINEWILASDSYTATGFKNLENGRYAIKDSRSDIKVAIRHNLDGALVYEAALPIKHFFEHGLTKSTMEKSISVGIDIHNNNTALGQRRNNGGGSGGGFQPRFQPRIGIGGGFGGFGVGIGGGGGGRRGGSGGNQQGQQPNPENNVFWYTFSLAGS